MAIKRKIRALNAVIAALDAGYLDELFAGREARDAFRDEVLGVSIRGAVDDMGVAVRLPDGIYYDGKFHPHGRHLRVTD